MDDKETERRIQLATKIALLEERAQQAKIQLDKIETLLSAHSDEEETLLANIRTNLQEMKNSFEDQIRQHVTPIEKDISRWKTIFATLTVVLNILWLLIEFCKDWIIHFVKS